MLQGTQLRLPRTRQPELPPKEARSDFPSAESSGCAKLSPDELDAPEDVLYRSRTTKAPLPCLNRGGLLSCWGPSDGALPAAMRARAASYTLTRAVADVELGHDLGRGPRGRPADSVSRARGRAPP